MQYKEQSFAIPDLKGISSKQIEVHLKLYAGYVKHVNLLRENIHALETEDKEKHAYTIAELRRRFSFEFNGMRMHEYYFQSFAGGPKAPNESGALAQTLAEKYGDKEQFIAHFKSVGMSRGIGWTILYWDPIGETPHIAWLGDHELGTLAGLPIILAMDMWEHAYMVDYLPAEKATYITAFLENTNWDISEKRFTPSA
ncbi:MAG TPA: Fe-Mn family superoxide dismutase [Candidatus Paceibacterota bacterium]